MGVGAAAVVEGVARHGCREPKGGDGREGRAVSRGGGEACGVVPRGARGKGYGAAVRVSGECRANRNCTLLFTNHTIEEQSNPSRPNLRSATMVPALHDSIGVHWCDSCKSSVQLL